LIELVDEMMIVFEGAKIVGQYNVFVHAVCAFSFVAPKFYAKMC